MLHPRDVAHTHSGGHVFCPDPQGRSVCGLARVFSGAAPNLSRPVGGVAQIRRTLGGAGGPMSVSIRRDSAIRPGRRPSSRGLLEASEPAHTAADRGCTHRPYDRIAAGPVPRRGFVWRELGCGARRVPGQSRSKPSEPSSDRTSGPLSLLLPPPSPGVRRARHPGFFEVTDALDTHHQLAVLAVRGRHHLAMLMGEAGWLSSREAR